MRTVLLLIAAIATAFAADDSWTKVKDLKSGTELRIVRDGAKQPLLAQMDHATDESLYIATKRSSSSVPKSEITSRLPPAPNRQSANEAEHGQEQTGRQSFAIGAALGGRLAGPSSSASSSVSIGSKPDFETIYRRIPGAPPLK